MIRGIGRTGRLATCAALILFLALVAVGSGPSTELKMFATAWTDVEPTQTANS